MFKHRNTEIFTRGKMKEEKRPSETCFEQECEEEKGKNRSNHSHKISLEI